MFIRYMGKEACSATGILPNRRTATLPFDVTTKALIELRPADWAAFLGVSVQEVAVIEADVSTVTAAADKVLRIRGSDGDRIQHLEFQSGPDKLLPRRTHRYNALLEDNHELPVDSIVVLLRPEANLRVISGLYEQRLPGESKPYLRFRYRVIRVWKLSVETIFQAGLGLLPLAPISNVRKNELPAVIDRMKQRLAAEPDQTTVGEMWTATKVLLGLRYDAPLIGRLLQGVHAMKESTTYQAILDEGRQEGLLKGLLKGHIEEARRLVIRLGTKRFGVPPTTEENAALDAILDLARLEDLLEKTDSATSWPELLAGTKPTRSRRRKS